MGYEVENSLLVQCETQEEYDAFLERVFQIAADEFDYLEVSEI